MKELIKRIPGVRSSACVLRGVIKKIMGRYQGQQYDKETFQVMQRVLQDQSSAIDVGANRGEILREILKLAPNGHHWAFEPIVDLHSALQREFPTVKVLSYALAETSGRMTFHVAKQNPAYSSMENRDPDLLKRIGLEDTSMELIDVEVRRMDDVIPESAHIDFIKIDVEGSELRTLEGSVRTLSRCKPVVVFEAGFYGEARVRRLFELFGSCGLQLSIMSRWLRNERSTESFPEFLALAKKHYYFIAYP